MTLNKELKKAGLIIKYLIVFCSIFTPLITKGEAVHKFTIFFESNTSELSQNSKAKIDSVLKRLSNTPKAYSVGILGYTDNVGNSSFNKNLSVKRASATASYFTEKRFSKKKINYSGNGLSNPVSDNDTDKGKSKNRRVEITLRLDIPRIKSIAGIKPEVESYKLKANEGGTIENPNGTKIIIPPAAFVDKKGISVSGEIEIRYREEREPVDFLLGGIHMSYEHSDTMHHFNSAGMFKILAYKNGEPVYLKNGEQIKIDFPLTKDLENLNFYRFDTVSNRWFEIAQLTGRFDTGATSIPMMCGWSGGDRICSLDECDGFWLVEKLGISLSKKDDSIFNEFKKADLLNTANFRENWRDIVSRYDELKKEDLATDKAAKGTLLNQNKIGAINRDIQARKNDKSNRYYQLKGVKIKKNSATFRLIGKAKKWNEMEAFNKVLWQYTSKNESIHDSVFKVKWKHCQVTPSANSETYDIVLTSSGGEVEINNVKMIPKKKIKKAKLKEFKEELIEQYKSVAQYYRRVEYLDTLMSKLPDGDSLFCLWDKSKPYMTKAERELSITEWFMYFEENKTSMLQRYSNGIKSNPKYDSCKVVFEERERMRIALAIEQAKKQRQRIEADSIAAVELAIERAKKLKQRNEADSLAKSTFGSLAALNDQNDGAGNQANVTNASSGAFNTSRASTVKSLTIPSLGIYNCDQIRLLESPIEIFAEYKDEKGKMIEPLFVYLIDSRVNGMMLYDGYMEYSPYKFAFSPTSKNTLIAIDENQTAYVISSEQFEGKNKQAKCLFTAKRIDKLKNKDELKEIL